VPILQVHNKIDLVSAEDRERLRAREPGAVPVSARTGEGVDELLRVVGAELALDTRRVTVRLDGASEADRRKVARLYQVGTVVSHVTSDGSVVIEADVPRRFLARLAPAKAGEELIDAH
jgi:GTP-binding protein HflX